MSSPLVEQQTKEIVEALLSYNFSQVYDILPEEKKLISIRDENPKSTYPLIGLMLANIMLGNKTKALQLGKEIWNLGGELSIFFEVVYIDCLLDLGEIKKASALLKDRLANMAAYVTTFYKPMVKYAIVTADFELLSKIGEFDNNQNKEPFLFLYAERALYNDIKNDVLAIIRIANDNLGDACSAFGYKAENNGIMNLIFYTNAEVEQNQNWHKKIQNKIESYYLSSQKEYNSELAIKILNIKLHPAINKQINAE